MSDLEKTTPPHGEYISDKIRRELLESTPSGKLVLEDEELEAEARRETSINEVDETLGITIMHDHVNRVVLYLNFLLTYLGDAQQNILFNAPSSTGKSYLALEVAKYFPEEDQLIKGYTSPTAFFHENSELVDDLGNPVPTRGDYVHDSLEEWGKTHSRPAVQPGDKPTGAVADWKDDRDRLVQNLKREWDLIPKVYHVDLRHKLLIFLDQPQDDLLKNLRPVLSHDRERVEINITDKTREGGHRTKKVLILGFPTVCFCSAAFSLDEQERTRFWTLSPEMSQSKFRDTLRLQTTALGDPENYRKTILEDRAGKLLRTRVRLIKDQGIGEVLIHEEDRLWLYDNFLVKHPNLAPRHQRDYPRTIALIKALALHNSFSRERTPDGKGVYANRDDVIQGFELGEELNKSNELGIPPYIYQFWEEHFSGKLADLGDYGMLRKEVSALYWQTQKHRLSGKSLKAMMDLLTEVGLIYEQQDPDDRRQMRIYPLQGGGENSSSLTVNQGGSITSPDRHNLSSLDHPDIRDPSPVDVDADLPRNDNLKESFANGGHHE
jgi:hypothetical protein